jgi:hypothetical protein
MSLRHFGLLASALLAGVLIVTPVKAATFTADVLSDPNNSNASRSYDKNWKFNVTIDDAKNELVVKVEFNKKTYTYRYATTESGGIYSFDSSTTGNPSNPAGLRLKGTFNPKTNQLVFTQVTSGPVSYTVSNIKPVPEPALLLGLATMAGAGLLTRPTAGGHLESTWPQKCSACFSRTTPNT